jgi:hypothetical protein
MFTYISRGERPRLALNTDTSKPCASGPYRYFPAVGDSHLCNNKKLRFWKSLPASCEKIGVYLTRKSSSEYLILEKTAGHSGTRCKLRKVMQLLHGTERSSTILFNHLDTNCSTLDKISTVLRKIIWNNSDRCRKEGLIRHQFGVTNKKM